jgi:hypothetical protein
MTSDKSGQPAFKAPAAPADNLADDQKQLIRNIQAAMKEGPQPSTLPVAPKTRQDEYAARAPEGHPI